MWPSHLEASHDQERSACTWTTLGGKGDQGENSKARLTCSPLLLANHNRQLQMMEFEQRDHECKGLGGETRGKKLYLRQGQGGGGQGKLTATSVLGPRLLLWALAHFLSFAVSEGVSTKRAMARLAKVFSVTASFRTLVMVLVCACD